MPEVHLNIICSGSALLSRFGSVVDHIRQDGFVVADELHTLVEGNEPINMALTLASTIQLTASSLLRIRPDLVVTIADRYETLGTAAAAAYIGLPLVHVQGGEITGNIDEKVRHAVTKLSDFHLVSTDIARQRLIRMGESPDSIVVTGCPSIDLAREAYDLRISEVQHDIDALGTGKSVSLKDDYLVFLLHPETETYEESFNRATAALEATAAIEIPVVVFWPNPDAGTDAVSKAVRLFRERHPSARVNYQKNLEGHGFLRLLKSARCLVGNSSVGIRECSYLGTPVVNIGDRQHGRDRARNVLDCSWDRSQIESAIRHQIAAGSYPCSVLYGNGDAGPKIAEALISDIPIRAKRFYDS
jgi:UDP-hydrolysing UDP-N-acetyl-D-glucosamine 2-epimerase